MPVLKSSNSHKPLAIAVLLAMFFLVSASPAHTQWSLSKDLQSPGQSSSSWVKTYDASIAQIYQSNINEITQQAIDNSKLFAAHIIRRSARRDGSLSPRQQREKEMTVAEQAAAEHFAKYEGSMFKEAKAPIMPAKLAARFANPEYKATDQVLLTTLFTHHLAVYKQRAAQQGAPSNDLVRSVAYCVATNYLYFTGGTAVSEDQLAAFRGDLRTALSEDAKFRALTDVQKQQMSETMIIMASFVSYGIDNLAPRTPYGKRNAVRQGFRQLAATNLQGLLGVDPARVSFNANGLVIGRARAAPLDLN